MSQKERYLQVHGLDSGKIMFQAFERDRGLFSFDMEVGEAIAFAEVIKDKCNWSMRLRPLTGPKPEVKDFSRPTGLDPKTVEKPKTTAEKGQVVEDYTKLDTWFCPHCGGEMISMDKGKTWQHVSTGSGRGLSCPDGFVPRFRPAKKGE